MPAAHRTAGPGEPGAKAPAEVVRYVDPVEGFRGYVAFAGTAHRLAAGGLRVQPGVDEDTVVRLARTMALKERLLGLAVDGAKAGIDYDPRSPGRLGAMSRFLAFVRPLLEDRLSLGPDMGTGWAELERLARAQGLVSVKAAVQRAQGLAPDDFITRLRLLDADVDGATLGERRAGHALAHAALGAIDAVGARARRLRVGVHGFGTLGRGVAMGLTDAGLTPTVVTDVHTCLHCRERSGGSGETVVDVEQPGRFFDLPLDVVVLASCDDALTPRDAARLDASVVVVGANLGLRPEVEAVLHDRGVLVVPDFVGGCGGSASMDALFGPPTCPEPRHVLESVGRTMRALVAEMAQRSRRRGITPREAALSMCETAVAPGSPYGRAAR